MQRIGNQGLIERAGQRISFALALDGAALLQRFDHLFDKKRIAFGFPGNQRLQRLGQLPGGQCGPRHPAGIARRQRG